MALFTIKGVTDLLFRIPVRECARTLWIGAPSWREGGRVPQAGTKSVSWAQIREEERRDEMRKWQEVKEDYPFMASRCEHAQSKLTCIAQEESMWMCRWHCIRCIYCFRKINHLVLIPTTTIPNIYFRFSVYVHNISSLDTLHFVKGYGTGQHQELRHINRLLWE